MCGILTNIPMGARLCIERLVYTGKYVRRYVALTPKLYKTLLFLFHLCETCLSLSFISEVVQCLMVNACVPGPPFFCELMNLSVEH